MKALNRFLRLQPGEAGLVIVMAILLLGNSLSQQLSEITAISNFLSTGGVNQILIVWLVDSLVILGITGMQSLVIDRFSRIKLTKWLLIILGLLFILLRILFLFQTPKWFIYALMYVISEQQYLFVPLVFWVLANDVFDMSQAKRLFPLIASGGFAGRLIGIGVAAVMPFLSLRLPAMKPEDLLIFITLIYLIIYIFFAEGMRKVKTRQTVQAHQTVRETLSEGQDFVREVPSFRYLTLAILAIGIIITVIDFRFLVVSNATFPDPNRFQTFYSLYRLALTLVAIVIQGSMTSRLIEGLGLKNTFLILPVILLMASALPMAVPTILFITGGISLARLSQATVDESARKAFQALVPEERRGRVSMFMDSYLFAGGTILGCLITGTVVVVGVLSGSSTYHYIYLGIAVLASILSIWFTLKMRSVYDTSLLNWRLKRRQHRTSVLDKLDF